VATSNRPQLLGGAAAARTEPGYDFAIDIKLPGQSNVRHAETSKSMEIFHCGASE